MSLTDFIDTIVMIELEDKVEVGLVGIEMKMITTEITAEAAERTRRKQREKRNLPTMIKNMAPSSKRVVLGQRNKAVIKQGIAKQQTMVVV